MSIGPTQLAARPIGLRREGRRAAAPGAWHARHEAIMGTPVRVELWSTSSAAAREAMDAVMAEMHRIDRTMSPYKAESELSLINREAGRAPIAVSEEMFGLLCRAQQFSELSNGAFDITYASVGHLYDYRHAIGPTDEALTRARQAIGWRHLKLDASCRTVSFEREGMRIDLGGFAKGHAVDNCIALLKQRGIRHAMVSAGGDSHVMGDRRGRPWTIAIRDPRRADDVVAVLPLEDVSISTSGDYERYFERDGVRFHHLIDPRTGRSPSMVRSVTILAGDGLTSEGWSKCVFVLGVEEGMRLIESQAGVDAVVVDADGELHCSSGLLSPDAVRQ